LIKIVESILKEIRIEGEKSYPNECCGTLLGTLSENGGKEAALIFPITNTAGREEQFHRFFIAPDDYIKAELYAAKKGFDILGFYHSHPDHPAAPSEYDRENALPFYSYLIVSVYDGKAEDITCWELSSDGRNFIKEL
jgi:proteasome lid subunit RPN8/RPN11